MDPFDSLIRAYYRAGNWLLPLLRQKRELSRLPVRRLGPCSVHFDLGGGEHLAYFGISSRRETLRQRAIRTVLAAYPLATSLTLPSGDRSGGMDTYLHEQSSDNNYGGSVEIRAGTGGSFASHPQRGLIQFTGVSGIPANATITSGIVSLYCSSEGDTNDRNVMFHKALVQWWEGSQDGGTVPGGQDGSTWNKRNVNGGLTWGEGGGKSGTDYVAAPTATTSITGASAWYTWDVKTDVAAWAAGTATNYGHFVFGMEPWPTYSGSEKMFASSDNATAENRPYLTVTYLSAAKKGGLSSLSGLSGLSGI